MRTKVTKSKILITSLLCSVGVLSCAIGVSVAWYVHENTENVVKMDGSILAKYFHCGTGKETDPFIISRPQHWENLVWLHNNVDNFWNAGEDKSATENKGFYFEIGCSEDRLADPTDDNGGDGRYTYASDAGKPKYVYNYTDSGTTSEAITTELNLKATGHNYIPIGAPDKPFIGSLNGNGLVVKNFTVASKYTDSSSVEQGLTDLGIFGFVGTNANCNDVYFRNFTIDTTGNSVAHSEDVAVPGQQGKEHLDHTAHESHGYMHSAYAGYIAGHILYSARMNNVYVNECAISGSNGGNTNHDNFGYYGMVDNDNGGGGARVGGDYSFTLNSQAVYNYVGSRYNNTESGLGIVNEPMRLRNSGYVHESDELPSETEINAMAKDQQTGIGKYPVSKGIVRGGDWIQNGGYDLNGKTSTTDTSRSYSLSTMGYYGAEYQTNAYNEQIYYKDGNNYYDPDIDMELVDHPLSEDSSGGENGKYYRYWTGSKWQYYVSHRYDDTTNKTLTVNIPTSFSFTVGLVVGRFDDTNAWVETKIYLDEETEPRYTFRSTAHAYQNSLIGRTMHWDIYNGQQTSQAISLPSGTHSVAVTNEAYSSEMPLANKSRYFIYPSTSARQSVDLRTANQSITATPGASRDSAYTPAEGTPYTHYIHDYPGTTSMPEKDVYTGHKDEDGQIIYSTDPLDVQNAEFTCEKSYDSETGELVDYQWNTFYSKSEAIPGTDRAHYLGGFTDEELSQARKTSEDLYQSMLAENESNQIYQSGYRSENIDVVGGQINFGQTYITMRGKSQRTQMSPVITSTDINQPFYATKYAPSSIVMYVRNSGGSKDEDWMGDVNFKYGITVLGSSLKQPIFRGAGPMINNTIDYYGFDDFAAAKEAGDLVDENDYIYEGPSTWYDFDRSAFIKLRRGYIKKCAYCGLDANGNILCGFDKNGNQVGATGVRESQIKTYVLIFSVICPSTIFNTRIQEIDFNFKATAGGGGSFGPVDYRFVDQDKVSNNIMNFYVHIEENTNISYYIYVEYDEQQKLYRITFQASDTSLTMNVFMVQPEGETYYFSVNGSKASSDSETSDIPAVMLT